MTPIDFYFDFSSPYGYLASERIDALAARFGREVDWHPILLGVVFKATGAAPLTTVPLKGDYSRHDFARSARFMGIPFAMPAKFPLATQHAARAFYWLNDRDPALARAFAHGVFRALYVEGRDVSELPLVLEIAAGVGANFGADVVALQAALGEQPLKDRLRAEVEAAIARGVFGSPYIIVDGEPFMGADRLPQIERWLATGGF